MSVNQKERFCKIPLDILAKAFDQMGYVVNLKMDHFTIKQDLCNWIKVRYIEEKGGCLIKIFSLTKGIIFSSETIDKVIKIANKMMDKKGDGVKTSQSYCPECGKLLPHDAKFCPSCGHKL